VLPFLPFRLRAGERIWWIVDNSYLCRTCWQHPVEDASQPCAFCQWKQKLIEAELNVPDPVIHRSAVLRGWATWNANFTTEIGPFDTASEAVKFFKGLAEDLLLGRP
jgi:hypothetical protein